MKKVTCLLLLLLIGTACYSLTPKEMENELHVIRGNETMSSKKALAYQLLEIDTFNAEAVRYLALAYSIDKQEDSTRILINRLIEENPTRPEPYLLGFNRQNLTLTQQIDWLKKAYKLDSRHANVNYELGKLYYQLFNNEYVGSKDKKKLTEFSRNAITYFSNLCDIDKSYREALRYPLQQLATYLGDTGLKARFEQFNVQSTHFPLSAFVVLPTNWQTDFSVDVMGNSFKRTNDLSKREILVSGVESAKNTIERYSHYLRLIDEPVLTMTQTENVFRLTWLRSFNRHIVFGLEKNANAISIYWKEFDESGKIIIKNSRRLTQKDWTDFVAAIQAINFWNIPTIKANGGLDGETYVLEGKMPGNYHVVDRWSGDEIKSVCAQLMGCISIKIESGN